MAPADMMAVEPLRLGLMLEALAGRWQSEALGPLLAHVLPAIRQGRSALWFDGSLRLAGCALWDTLSAADFDRAMADVSSRPCVQSAPAGRHVFVRDYAAAPGQALRVARAIEAQAGATAVRMGYGRPAGLGQLGRVWRPRARPVLAGAAPLASSVRKDLIETRRTAFLRALELGQICELLSRSVDWGGLTLPAVLKRVRVAALHRQARLALDDAERCRAWLTWLWLTDSAGQRLERLGPDALHAADWDEGEQLVWLDQVGEAEALQGLRAQVMAGLRVRGFEGEAMSACRDGGSIEAGWVCVPSAESPAW